MRRLSFIGAAALALVIALGVSADAFTFSQRVLVYCPPGDTSGCDAIVAALGNADKGYDGNNGTVDLATADLSSYAVLVIPSLADDGDVTPYARLRDSAVAAHLRKSVLGRRAFWSGTPDQGTSNREAKNALLTRLSDWAGGNHTAVGAPGLLVLQDVSTSGHYNWVAGITGINVIADPAIRTYSAVRAVTEIGTSIVGGAAYTNMASRGFFLPQGAAGISLDAVGQTGTTVGGQIVLMTHPGATEHQAVVSTDKDDYEPYETVIISGSGFVAGESVVVTLEEDPIQHDLRSFTVTADENGAFTYTEFKPEEHDLDVRFILTAKGATSNRVAQTTFTDAIVRAATLYFGVGHATNDTLIVPAPATATVAGDVLIAQITVAEATAGVTCAGSGWVLERSDSAHLKVRQAIFSRVVTVGEAGGTLHRFTFRAGAGVNCSGGGALSSRSATGHITRYTGVDNTDPVEAVNGSASASSGTTFTAPSVNTALTNARVMRFVGIFKNTAITGPVNSVKLYGTGSSTDKERHAAAWDTTQVASGATGTFAATASSAEWVAQTIVLRPAAAAKANGSITINNIPGAGVALVGGSFVAAYTKLGDGAASVASLTTGTCTVSGNTVSFIAAGLCTLQASVAEGTTHLAATGAEQSFTIGKAAGSVSINNIPAAGTALVGGSFVPAFTKAGDGTASAASLTASICTVTSGTVNFIAAGECRLQASVTEGTAHLAATGAEQPFTIGKAAGSVSINNIPAAGTALVGGSFIPAFTKAGDGTASAASLTASVCTITSGTVNFIAAGECRLQASVTEGTAHLAAVGAEQPFTIGKAAGSVSINNIPAAGTALVGGSFIPAFTKAGDGTASAASLTASICTVISGTVNFIAAGECRLQASVTEGTAHLAATGAEQPFTIAKAPGSVSINNIPGAGVAQVGGSFVPAYTKLGDGTASTASLTTSICTVTAGTVNFLSVGQCDLQASVTEGTAHLAATGSTQSFSIGAAVTTSVLAVAPASQQYSDTTVFTSTITPYEAAAQQLTGTVNFYVAAAIQNCAASPTGLVGSDVIADADNGVGSIKYRIDKPVGAYKVTACFVSSNSAFANSGDDEDLAVTAENAIVYDLSYLPNPAQVTTPGSPSSPAIVLSLKVKERYPETNSNLALAGVGNIDSAVVTASAAGVLFGGNTQMPCVKGATSGTGYNRYTLWTCTLAAGKAADTYDVSITVGGFTSGPLSGQTFYSGTGSTAIQISDPSLGFATGGGWFLAENGDRMNFGFMAKASVNNRKTVYQGSLLVIRHTSTGEVIKAKSNVFDGYSVKAYTTGGGSTTFTGKANYTVNGVSIGNFSFTGYAEDLGTPGSGVDKFGLYLASAGNQVATSTTLAGLVSSAKTLQGGNNQVPQPSKK
jgi:hypothetical protein